ncbi:MAG TPA: hypothetical protein VK171_13920 [Fimbriimonas sp.]|nr:hypothetical protein [Fimbriimonas sp.]
MHTEFIPEDPEVLKEMGVDRRDLNVPQIRKATTVITIACIVCFLASIPVYNYVSTPNGENKGGFFGRIASIWNSSTGSTREPAPPSRNKIPPPNPLLQDSKTTHTDIKAMRLHEDEVLGSYGWVDQNKGIVRVPIEEAIQMVAKKGVSTGNQVPAVSKGNTIIQNATGPATN